MSSNSPLDAWFHYAIHLSEMIYSMKLELYEVSCQAFIEEAVTRAAAQAASAMAQVTETIAASEKDTADASTPPPSPPTTSSAAAAAAAAMRTHEELFALSCMSRPPTVRKPAEDCIDWVEAEKEAVYHELQEGYTLTSEDEAALQACQRERGAATEAATTTTTTGKAAEDLLYGELTSVGVRQLHTLATRLIASARRGEDAHPAETCIDATSAAQPTQESPGYIMEAVDIGSGTGKILFEWSRLAAMEYLSHPGRGRSFRRPDPCEAPEHLSPTSPYAPVGTPTFSPTLPVTTSTPAPSLVDSFALSSATEGSERHLGTPNRRTATPASPLHDEGHGASADMAEAGLSPPTDMAGWLGVGVELVPSRMATARCAIAPNFLDLVEEEEPTLDGGGCTSQGMFRKNREEDAAVSTDKGAAAPRYTPAPPRAVAVRPKDSAAPVGRQPAGCVLLYEGDALRPGLLSNETLFRYPAPPPRPSSDASAGSPPSLHRIPGTENFFKLCRGIPRRGRLSGTEEVHLVLFCSGLGFDEGFVRPLCERLEALLPGHPDATAKGHWRSVTCVLLLRNDIPVKEAGFPLFRCAQRWRNMGEKASTRLPSAVHQEALEKGGEDHCVPAWCTAAGGGLVSSFVTTAPLEATWMSEAPAWVLHFRY